MKSLTVDELISKLQEVSNDGRGGLFVTIPAETVNSHGLLDRALVGIKDASWGDQGGWGVEISILSPCFELKLKKDK